ncbi:MAG: hypothetical protein QM530_07390 [Phycisphaerales bacterium]|nr:hypothetical protein [Phycisphaerales bacterium]
MKYSFLLSCSFLFGIMVLFACKKWQDNPASNLGLTNRYCNIPEAINYNHGFPGIEDNSVCVFAAQPFVGNYSFNDTVYTETDTLYPSAISFGITSNDRYKFVLNGFCSNTNQLLFKANRYYHAAADSIIGSAKQLMCRSVDTLSGFLDYRTTDSSLYIEFYVMSDTGISTHKGRAYKK